MATGILLIHGFTGALEDFGALPELLSRRFGADAVRAVRLPGHGGAEPPRFETEALLAEVDAAARAFTDRGDDLVAICHSTGGTILLAALGERLSGLRLLVLAASPKRIDGAYLARWSVHAAPGNAISFTSLASLVHLVNGVRVRPSCPVLLLQGEEDELVPPGEVLLWEQDLGPQARTVLVPDAGHHLFRGESAPFVQDLLLRAVSDAAHRPTAAELEVAARLADVEPESAGFLSRSPHALRHLAASPAALSLAGHAPGPGAACCGEPIFLNIEITTRCDLRCAFCARGARGTGADMPVATFRRILDLLPHGYRVTLVGLGEPLMHPEIATLVGEAVSRGRRVSLVTNAMGLDAELGRRLLDAGLHAITFSLDAATQDLADRVRHGSDLERILANIRAFGKLSDAGRRVSRAVFSAVSLETLPHLEELVRVAATLGVDAMMLSDLNFSVNSPHSLLSAGKDVALGSVRQAVRTAFSLGLPVLSVHGLEELGLSQRYHRHLLSNPSRMLERPAARTHCVSPWQTIAVAVDGTVTACDCQPGNRAGNLLRDPFDAIWQGPVLTAQRRDMLGGAAPHCCSICPRF